MWEVSDDQAARWLVEPITCLCDLACVGEFHPMKCLSGSQWLFIA